MTLAGLMGSLYNLGVREMGVLPETMYHLALSYSPSVDPSFDAPIRRVLLYGIIVTMMKPPKTGRDRWHDEWERNHQ